MDKAQIDVLSGALGAVVTAFTAFVAWYLGRRTQQQTAEQIRLNSASFAMEWMRDLRSWASEAIDVLSEAASTCEQLDKRETVKPDNITDSLRSCRIHLSSLVNRGRFFLPNSHRDQHGLKKPPAYRGFRHAALNPSLQSGSLTATSVSINPDAMR